jgi:hypothetical protein
MIAETLHHRPFALTAAGILLGAALIATRSVPLAVVGAALIVAGLLVPLIRFGAQTTTMTVTAPGATTVPLAMVVRDLAEPEVPAAKVSEAGLSWFVIETFRPPVGSAETADMLLRKWQEEAKRAGFDLPEHLVAAAKRTDVFWTWSAGHLHRTLSEDREFVSMMANLVEPGTSLILAVRETAAGPQETASREDPAQREPTKTDLAMRWLTPVSNSGGRRGVRHPHRGTGV